jgi:4-amino-4-deoxy-L-arabinose transferase-like glycosyltransferase
MPWTPAALAGFFVTAGAMWRRRSAIARLLWCWAIVPILVLSLPHRKHHHYLVPSLAPWAIMAAIGAVPILRMMFAGKSWSRHPVFGAGVIGMPIVAGLIGFHRLIPMLTAVVVFLAIFLFICVVAFYIGQWTKDGRLVLAAIAVGVAVVFNLFQTYWPDPNVTDDQFLHRADAMAPRDRPLIVNASVGPLDFFRIQFNLRPTAKLIQNLTYLRGTDIQASDVYVVSRVRDLPDLRPYGEATLVAESTKTRRETGPQDRFALFHLTFAPGLKRYPPPAVSPMQAMLRKPGPVCGPAGNN